MNFIQRLLAKPQEVNRLELEAEEKECAMLWLDDMQVPRANEDGQTYSLVGRMGMFEQQVRKSCKELWGQGTSGKPEDESPATRLCIDCKHAAKRDSDGQLMCGKSVSLVDGLPVEKCIDMRYPTYLLHSIWAGADIKQRACWSAGYWWEPKEVPGPAPLSRAAHDNPVA